MAAVPAVASVVASRAQVRVTWSFGCGGGLPPRRAPETSPPPACLPAEGGAQDGRSDGRQVRPDHRGAHFGDVEAGGRDGAEGVAPD
jgi:hypothetical protein